MKDWNERILLRGNVHEGERKEVNLIFPNFGVWGFALANKSVWKIKKNPFPCLNIKDNPRGVPNYKPTEFSQSNITLWLFFIDFLVKLFAFIFILSVFLLSPNDQSNLQEKETIFCFSHRKIWDSWHINLV